VASSPLRKVELLNSVHRRTNWSWRICLNRDSVIVSAGVRGQLSGQLAVGFDIGGHLTNKLNLMGIQLCH